MNSPQNWKISNEVKQKRLTPTHQLNAIVCEGYLYPQPNLYGGVC